LTIKLLIKPPFAKSGALRDDAILMFICSSASCFFLNAVVGSFFSSAGWGSVTGTSRIVSDTLVMMKVRV